MFRNTRISILLFVLLALFMAAIWSGTVAAQEEVTPADVPADTVVDVAIVTPEPVDEQPPAPAEESATPALSENTLVAIVFVLAAVLTVALIAFAFLQNKSTQAIYKSFPAPVQTATGYGLEYLLGHAATTPSSLDDEALKKLAEHLGYTVSNGSGGRIILFPAHPPESRL
jgi:preprotein translocase subunit SecG